MNTRYWTSCFLVACWLSAHYASAIDIETVLIGNPGADGHNNVGAETPGIVDDAFRVGKYEVTNQQYTEFLNAVDPTGNNSLKLYHLHMGINNPGGIRRETGGASNGSWYSVIPGRGQYPVILVSWYDSARFTNWLHNGQGNGDTETGAYDIASHPLDRNANARWFLPTRDEWVKAAYHSNDASNSFYFAYPTASDIAPTPSPPSALPNQANIAKVLDGPTPVGSYPGSPSAYGTFDQAGNVREWTGGLTPSGSAGVQGGNWFNISPQLDSLNSRGYGVATLEAISIGFRVATIVPEPNSTAMFLIACTAFAAIGRRQRREH